MDGQLEVCDPDDIELEVIDIGDAFEETMQSTPFGSWPDCFFGLGSKAGCG